MIRRINIILLLLMTSTLYAQNRSINFVTTSLTEAFKMAREQHKMIFTDCYTVWCVPCKGMDKLVFTQDSVADFFNSHFINVKLDMEKGEGPAAVKTYKIGAFPTYLLFDENGKQVYKFVGGMSAAEFMAKIRIGSNPKNEEVEREARYAAGDRNPELMRDLIKQKFKQKDPKTGTALAEEYFKKLSPAARVHLENWFLFGESYDARYMSPIGSVNFNYLLANYKAFVASNGKEQVDNKIYSIFKSLASNSLAGYFFKGHPYQKEEFEDYKKLINKSQFPDKMQLLVLTDIAMAAGMQNAPAAGQLLAAHVDQLTEANKKVVFDYSVFCSAKDRTYPYMKEISNKVAKSSNNPFLIKHCAEYAQRSTFPATSNE